VTQAFQETCKTARIRWGLAGVPPSSDGEVNGVSEIKNREKSLSQLPAKQSIYRLLERVEELC
jgi:hypothetical protein